MIIKTIERYNVDTRKVQGWMSSHDVSLFHILLSMQRDENVTGNLLEIGVFEGKSAILLGRLLSDGEEFHVCDIFDELTDTKNAEEILSSYPNFSREKFESNMLKLSPSMPEIHQCLSSELPKRLAGKKFRFVHIDGSHLYQHVSGDLKYAEHAISESFGIISVDDFRSQHTPGVAAAVWESIVRGRLVPIAISPAKMYLSKPNSHIDKTLLETKLKEVGLTFVTEDFLGYSVLRTTGLQDSELYKENHRITAFVPPILIDLVRNSYFWKRFRNR